jgi:hypothetical protein
MPFGLKNAPGIFQRLINESLLGLEDTYVQVYMDDIIVFSRSHGEHKEHLERILARLKEFGLKISREKSSFFRSEVRFMGHIISAYGVKPNEDKVAAIRDIPVPGNVKEVRSFLGEIN